MSELSELYGDQLDKTLEAWKTLERLDREQEAEAVRVYTPRYHVWPLPPKMWVSYEFLMLSYLLKNGISAYRAGCWKWRHPSVEEVLTDESPWRFVADGSIVDGGKILYHPDEAECCEPLMYVVTPERIVTRDSDGAPLPVEQWKRLIARPE